MGSHPNKLCTTSLLIAYVHRCGNHTHMILAFWQHLPRKVGSQLMPLLELEHFSFSPQVQSLRLLP